MTPTDLRAWATRLGYSRADAAAALATSVRTYDGWVQGRRAIPDMVGRLAEYVERFGLLPPARADRVA